MDEISGTIFDKTSITIEKGMRVDLDGRIRTTFTHNPSSLRLSSTNPNLQNIPRGTGKGDEIERWVKECFVAPKGSLFWERDFSAIEAVLVGYFAGSPQYIRFARLGVHAYLASHLANQPVDLHQTDEQIKAQFAELKKSQPSVYDIAKRCVHLSNYMGTPKRMHDEYPETFPSIKDANRVQGLYFELFPEIRVWHKDLCERVDGTKIRRLEDTVKLDVDPWTLGVAHAVNPFGYVHRFYNVLDWEKINHEWFSSYGEDAKRLVSFLPQSTAAAIIKRAGKRLFVEYPGVGRTMRLWVHDSIIGEEKEEDIQECLNISRLVMEEPIPELPLDPTWNLGSHLFIATEAKVGKSWASLRTVGES